MSNYTKSDVLDRLNGMTVLQVARLVKCHESTVYDFLKGKLSSKSRVKAKIHKLLGIETEELEPSVKDKTGLTAIEIAEIAGVSKASVHNWHRRVLEIENIKQPIDSRIELALEAIVN